MKWTFVGKEMSLLFNMLSRLVITEVQPKEKKCHYTTDQPYELI